MEVHKWEARDVWTFDAWDKALDWDWAHPGEAAAFLKAQGLGGQSDNLTSKVLRGVGFIKLYEEGRIEAVTGGEGTGDTRNIKAILQSFHELRRDVPGLKQDIIGLKRKTNMLKAKVTKIEGKNGMEIFVKSLCGEIFPLKVQSDGTVSNLKTAIEEWEGVQPLVKSAHLGAG
jgi:hypothetical protein